MAKKQPIICADGLYKKRNGEVVYLRREWPNSKYIFDDYGCVGYQHTFYGNVLTGEYWPDTSIYLVSGMESESDIVEQVY